MKGTLAAVVKRQFTDTLLHCNCTRSEVVRVCQSVSVLKHQHCYRGQEDGGAGAAESVFKVILRTVMVLLSTRIGTWYRQVADQM